MQSRELRSIGRYQLIKPMKFTASFSEDDNMWFLENEEFGIIGGGNSEAEIIQSLEDHFEGLVVSHPDVKPERFSEGSVKLHKKLEEYIDFNQASEVYKSKYIKM